MATGIVSMGLHLIGAEVLSLAALALASAAWVLLGIGFVRRLVLDRGRWAAEARSPAALTAAAATAVLASRLATLGPHPLAEALLALAAVLWAVLLPIVVRHWRSRMPGAVFLCCVATQGLVVSAAALAAAEHRAWLAHTALVLFWLGLLLYAFALPRFDARQVLEGPGDHWIAGGALAISALAGAGLLAAGDTGGPYLWNDDDRDALRTMTVLLLALCLAAYVALLVAEVVRPRLRYDQRRWATIFPLGMTAAAALSVGPRWASPGSGGRGMCWSGWRWRGGSGWPPARSPTRCARPAPDPAGSGPEHRDEDVRRGQRADQPELRLVDPLLVPLHVHEAEDHDQQRQLDADLDGVDLGTLRLIEPDQGHTGDQHGQRPVQHPGHEPRRALAHRLHLGEETTEQRGDADDVQADEEVDEYVHGAGA